MIRTYFNLSNLPFQKNMNNLFQFDGFKECLSRLEYIKNTRGFMQLTGDPGSGKTTALRHFCSKLNMADFQYFYIPLATVSILDFYRQLNFYLNGTTLHKKSQMFTAIQEGIKNMLQNKRKCPIIVLDEAHLLKLENFQELQIISNFDFDSVNPASIILCGQSHLRDRLNLEILSSVKQRLAIKYHLIPLTKLQVFEYIKFHMKEVNASSDIFSDSAVDAIHINSAGNLRATGNLALKSLYVACSNKKKFVSEEEVFLASKEI